MIQEESTVNAPTHAWVAVWTASRAEKAVASRVEARGIEAWLPTFSQRRRWSDRWRQVVLPLFPGYLFARVSSTQWLDLLRVSGVLTLVKSGGRPARMSDEFIATLRSVLQRPDIEAEALTSEIDYAPGDEVLVRDGPLAGLRGVVQENRNGRWLDVWVREIGRGARFTIGSAIVSPAEARLTEGSFTTAST